MRADANQQKLPLKRRVSGPVLIPRDAPDNVVTYCRSEAHAVRTCLEIAMALHQRDQLRVAMACGWKSDSCLSEIASESNARRMPVSRRERFAVATGCNLLSQYIDRQEAIRLAAGKTTEADRVRETAAVCLAAWGAAA